jgi:hypothetical protein
MSKAFDSIKRGLLEAIQHAEGRAPQPGKQGGADGAPNLRPAQCSRKAFAQELALHAQALPMGLPVMEQLRQEERY